HVAPSRPFRIAITGLGALLMRVAASTGSLASASTASAPPLRTRAGASFRPPVAGALAVYGSFSRRAIMASLLKNASCAYPTQSAAISRRDYCPAFAAASMMTAATSLGFESIGTWLVSSSFVVALMRFAKKRSSSGSIARSLLATMYHDGFVFHATLDTLAPKAEVAIGVCVAAS